MLRNIFTLIALAFQLFQPVCYGRHYNINSRALCDSMKNHMLNVNSCNIKSVPVKPSAFINNQATGNHYHLFTPVQYEQTKHDKVLNKHEGATSNHQCRNLAVYLKSQKTTLDTESVYQLNGGNRKAISVRSVPEGSYHFQNATKASPVLETVKGAVKNIGLLSLWYAGTVMYNVTNKKALNMCNLPLTISALQMSIGIPIYLARWLLGTTPIPAINIPTDGIELRDAPTDGIFAKICRRVKNGLCRIRNTINAYKSITTQALYNASLHALSVTALGAGAVSFVHIMKASEPIFASIASYVLGGGKMSLVTFMTLGPIVGGVAWSSLKELNFSSTALVTSLASNIFASIKRVEAKNFFKQDLARIGRNLTPSNVFSLVSIFSSFMLAPLVYFEKDKWAEMYDDIVYNYGEEGIQQLGTLLVSSGLAYALYNEMSFIALSQLTPVSHAVANTIKRIFLIMTSALFFNTKLTHDTIYGSSMAVAGTLLYSLSKHYLG
ncbi:Sugar phosphate transporter domain [Babesia duncani]|uniref:Sugar phosphate transporter domain n=1 Tax=Babesia duncani TaxID=323732 RepID=A0AAD9PIW9_9APIC|nr:Sugar phosphate transporter domain [Babesia duncani]